MADQTGYDEKQEPPKPLPEDQAKDWEAAIADWVEHVEDYNLVPYFAESEEGRKFLASIADQVMRDTQRGIDNSEEYREKRRRNYQMLTGSLPPKSFPFDKCANVHSPLLMEHLLRLVANVYAEFFNTRDTIFGVAPTGPDDYESAEILSLHGNWQLRNQLTDFPYQMERALMEFFGAGSTFSHSWYDDERGRNRHDVLNCEELIIPYVYTTLQVDMSDVPWKTRIVRKFKHEVQAIGRRGTWARTDQVTAKSPPGWDVFDVKVREQGQKHEGIVAPEADPTAPYVFFDYSGWGRMPGETDARPICAVVDTTTRLVVQLYIRDEEDWEDRLRFEHQQKELQAFQSDTMAYEEAKQAEDQLRMRMQMPDILPDEQESITNALQMEPLQPPEPPKWWDGASPPKPIKRVPIENFAHGRCADNPAGALGLSFGQALGDLNRLVDEAYNRLYDSATLANIWSIITPENLDLGSNTIALSPGKILKAKGFTGEQLRNQIVELRPSPASPDLMNIIKFASENASAAVAAPGVLSGEAGKSGETFRGIATRIERATKQLSAAGIKYLAFLEQILKNNARLNSLFMPEEQIIQVANHFMDIRNHTIDPKTGQPQSQVRVSRELYRRSYSVTFTADVRFTSQAQRISEADEILAMAGQIPQLATNPSFMYAAVTECLRARGKNDMIHMLGPAPPAPEQSSFAPPPAPPGMPAGQPGPGGPPPPGEPPGPGGPPPDGIPRPAVAPGPIQGPIPQAAA
jgi:hypothetical protein